MAAIRANLQSSQAINANIANYDPTDTTNNMAPQNAFNQIISIGRTDDYQGVNPVRLNVVVGRGVPVNIMRELDVKMDDGVPDTGVLRATINLGNPILAHEDPGTGQVGGVSVDLAQSLAEQLGVPWSPVVFKTASHAVDAVTAGQADVGFFAVDPLRGAGIAFTAPYVLIEGSYLVPEASPIRVNEEVDRPGNRVVVGQGSAYDLYLTRSFRHAEIVRAPTSPTVINTFVDNQCEMAVVVRQQLEAEGRKYPGLRLLRRRQRTGRCGSSPRGSGARPRWSRRSRRSPAARR